MENFMGLQSINGELFWVHKYNEISPFSPTPFFFISFFGYLEIQMGWKRVMVQTVSWRI